MGVWVRLRAFNLGIFLLHTTIKQLSDTKREFRQYKGLTIDGLNDQWQGCCWCCHWPLGGVCEGAVGACTGGIKPTIGVDVQTLIAKLTLGKHPVIIKHMYILVGVNVDTS